jgi:hypothetical protein
LELSISIELIAQLTKISLYLITHIAGVISKIKSLIDGSGTAAKIKQATSKLGGSSATKPLPPC